MWMAAYRYLGAVVLAWLVVFAIKSGVASVKARRLVLDLGDGGFPSGHAALTASVATMIGLVDGVCSPLFALAAVLFLIVFNDAIRTRFSVGEQGAALKSLISEQKSAVRPPRITRGHTLPEALAGAVLGAIVAVAVFFATK